MEAHDRPHREPAPVPPAPDAHSAAAAAQDRLPIHNLILAILMRTNRPCSPHEIMEAIAGAGIEAPDRQRLAQAIEVELMTAASSQGSAAFERREGRGDRWRLTPAFTAWLMSRGLPSLQGPRPSFPVETANDG